MEVEQAEMMTKLTERYAREVMREEKYLAVKHPNEVFAAAAAAAVIVVVLVVAVFFSLSLLTFPPVLPALQAPPKLFSEFPFFPEFF